MKVKFKPNDHLIYYTWQNMMHRNTNLDPKFAVSSLDAADFSL